jgi:hypothetical protein
VVMVLQSQFRELAMNFAYVYVILCNVRKRRKTSTVCKRERENKKRNKSCLCCFLFRVCFWQVVRGWSGVGGVESDVGCHSSWYDLSLPRTLKISYRYSSWQDCTLLISYRLIINSYHHGQCGRMFSHIGACSAPPPSLPLYVS